MSRTLSKSLEFCRIGSCTLRLRSPRRTPRLDGAPGRLLSLGLALVLAITIPVSPLAMAAPQASGRRVILVQVGAFRTLQHASALRAELRQKGYEAHTISGTDYHRVVVGPFATGAEATAALSSLKAAGFDGYIRRDLALPGPAEPPAARAPSPPAPAPPVTPSPPEVKPAAPADAAEPVLRSRTAPGGAADLSDQPTAAPGAPAPPPDETPAVESARPQVEAGEPPEEPPTVTTAPLQTDPSPPATTPAAEARVEEALAPSPALAPPADRPAEAEVATAEEARAEPEAEEEPAVAISDIVGDPRRPTEGPSAPAEAEPPPHLARAKTPSDSPRDEPSAPSVSQEATPKLKILILEGEGAINNIRQRTARDPVVQVVDENNRPVGGAAVTFTLPLRGSSGVFANGAKSVTLLSNAQGTATATGLTPNAVAGNMSIQVSASFQGQTASATIAQTNAAIGAGAGISGATLGIIGAIAAGAAVAAVAATGGGDDVGPPRQTGIATINRGGVQIGPPR